MNTKVKIEPYIICKDYSVSRETFSLFLNETYGYLYTDPKPAEDELARYYESEEYISHTDAKSSIMDKAYQLVKQRSLKRKAQILEQHQEQGRRLLDIGCGTGDFLAFCQSLGWESWGVEPNQGARTLAQGKLDKDQRVLERLNDFKSEKASFNAISLWHALEHLPNLEEDISTILALLDPRGTLLVAVPNYKSFDARHYQNHWAAYDVPRHLWHFSQESIHKLFEERNCTVVETLPLYFDSFYVSLLSEKYKTGKSKPISAFFRGLQSNWRARRSGEYSSLIYVIKKSNRAV